MNISPISRSAVYGLWMFPSPSRTRSRWVNMWTSVWTVFSPPPPLGYCLIIRRTAEWWMGELYQIALWRSHEICTQSCGQIWKQCFIIFKWKVQYSEKSFQALSQSSKCLIVLWHFLNLSKWDICPHRSSLSGSIVYSQFLTLTLFTCLVVVKLWCWSMKSEVLFLQTSAGTEWVVVPTWSRPGHNQ